MPKEDTERLRRTEALREDVRRLIVGHRDGESMQVPGVWSQLTLETYSRVRSHLESISLLVDAGYPVEGLELARTMLSDSLLLMELASRPDERMALAFGYYSKTISAHEALGKVAKTVGLARVGEWKPAVAKQRRELQEGMKHHKVDRLLHIGDVEKLARKHDRLDEAWNHRFMSTLVHRVDFGQAFRRQRGPDKTVHLHMRNKDPGIRSLVLAAALTSALYAHRAVADLLKWSVPPLAEVERLLGEVEELLPDSEDSAARD